MFIKSNKSRDQKYMEVAKLISTWSKDPSTQVGCVIVNKEDQIIAQGYNGFPRKVLDKKERYTNKNVKYTMIVHAEANAIISAGHECRGSSVYIYGLPCCNECAKLIIQSGIKNVIMCAEDISEKWKESFYVTKTMFEESGVSYRFL